MLAATLALAGCAAAGEEAPAPTVAADDACPLTGDQVSRAFGVSTPRVGSAPTRQVICTFAHTTGHGLDTTQPALLVAPFPLPSQRGETLSQVRTQLASAGRDVTLEPDWGTGAFMVAAPSSPTVEAFLPTLQITIVLPPRLAPRAKSIADSIARAASGGDAHSG